MNPNSLKKSDQEKDEFILADMHQNGVYFDESVVGPLSPKAPAKKNTNKRLEK